MIYKPTIESHELKHFLEELGKIRLGRVRGRRSPHKLLLLLAVLDRVDAGEITDNRIYYDPGLTERFRAYYDAIAQDGDWCQPGPPFFHLRSSGFWNHQIAPGREAFYAALTTSGGGNRRIVDNIQYAFFAAYAWSVVVSSEHRSLLRQSIIGSFFPTEEQVRLWQVANSQSEIGECEKIMERGAQYTILVSDFVRNSAFRRLILRAYENRCSVCGLRIITPGGQSPVDAAHLIPWSATHDDSPSNGMALCKLHHWALDAGLIAPTLSLEWAVSPVLDPQHDSERELTRFDKSPILLPADERHYPRKEAIVWRRKMLSR